MPRPSLRECARRSSSATARVRPRSDEERAASLRRPAGAPGSPRGSRAERPGSRCGSRRRARSRGRRRGSSRGSPRRPERARTRSGRRPAGCRPAGLPLPMPPTKPLMSAPAENARSPRPPKDNGANVVAQRLERVPERLEDRAVDGVDGRVVEPDGLDHGAVAGTLANISRSSVLLNLPTLVFGISATNSKRSGSHHLAKFGARNVPQLARRSPSGPRAARRPPAAARPTSGREPRSRRPRRSPGGPSARSRARPTRSTRRRT